MQCINQSFIINGCRIQLMLKKIFRNKLLTHYKKWDIHIKIRGEIGRTEVIKVLPDGKFEAIADNGEMMMQEDGDVDVRCQICVRCSEFD